MPIWRGVTNDWGTATNWDTGVVPTTLTDAIFDALSITPCTTGAVARNCRDLITTGFTNVLTVGTSTTLGYIQASRNVTLGSQVGHIAGLSYIGIIGATCTLDVAVGFTIPYLAFGSITGAGGTCLVTLVRSFNVTTIFKTGTGGTTATITAASAMNINLTNGSISGSNLILNTNVTLKFVGVCTMGNLSFFGGKMLLDIGATLTPLTIAGISAVLITGNTVIIDFAQGTFVNPPINVSTRFGFRIDAGSGNHTFNFGTNTLDMLLVSGGVGASAITLQSDLIINRTFFLGFGATIAGAFNIISKETLGIGLARTFPNGKIIYTGTSTGFIGMGYISGNTLTITTPIQGQLSYFSVIHVPSLSGVAANRITLCTTFNSVYTVTTSQTVGSAGSPVMFYGYGIFGITLGDTSLSSATLLEIDAGSNDVYLVGQVGIQGSASEFRYLSTNTGLFNGAKGVLAYSPYNGIIDFQGQSSSSKYVGNIGNTGFFSGVTLKSDLYVQNLSSNSGSGLMQIGSTTVFVMGNFSANNGTGVIPNTGAGVRFQPTIKLIGLDTCAFTCTTLVGDIIIEKGIGIVNVTQNFNYGATATLTTFKFISGVVNAGTTTVSAGGTVVFDTDTMPWYNITISAAAAFGINSNLLITNTLLLLGTVTFSGTHGFTTQNFACSVAASIITLQNINANPLAEYIVNGVLTLIGTLASRITLQAAGSSTFSGTITPVGQLNYISGVIPVIGMTVSQTTGISPVGLIGLLPARPVITAGVSPTFTITPSATAVIGTPFSMRAGYKAKFTLTNGTGSQNVAYTTTQDIDSNSGQTITSFGSNGDDTAVNTALFRTLNWGPLIAPSGSVYYTFVN